MDRRSRRAIARRERIRSIESWQFHRHLEHRVAEAEAAEDALGGLVRSYGPEDDSWRAAIVEPVDAGR